MSGHFGDNHFGDRRFGDSHFGEKMSSKVANKHDQFRDSHFGDGHLTKANLCISNGLAVLYLFKGRPTKASY